MANLTAEERSNLSDDKFSAKASEVYGVLDDAVTKLKELGFYEPQLDKVISAFEFVIDAVGYGYPGAVFEGWGQDVDQDTPAARAENEMSSVS